jgi:hypothetical protein
MIGSVNVSNHSIIMKLISGKAILEKITTIKKNKNFLKKKCKYSENICYRCYEMRYYKKDFILIGFTITVFFSLG